jgi:hypothetical protein
MEKKATPNANPGTKEDTMFSFITNTLQIDEIEWNEQRNSKCFTLDLDNGASLLWIVDFDADSLTGLARSTRTGQLLAWKVTGRTVRNEMVRVAVHELEDISLADGTLKANPERMLGGRVNEVFLSDPESALWNLRP